RAGRRRLLHRVPGLHHRLDADPAVEVARPRRYLVCAVRLPRSPAPPRHDARSGAPRAVRVLRRLRQPVGPLPFHGWRRQLEDDHRQHAGRRHRGWRRAFRRLVPLRPGHQLPWVDSRYSADCPGRPRRHRDRLSAASNSQLLDPRNQRRRLRRGGDLRNEQRQFPAGWDPRVACGGSVPPAAHSTTDSTDAGSPALPPGDPGDAGSRLAAEITYTETGFNLLAVDRAGTAYGVNLAASDAELWSSADGRAWSKRGATTGGASFWMLQPLSDGTLLADVATGAGHAIARSTDRGATWTEVLPLGAYRSLTPHSFA